MTATPYALPKSNLRDTVRIHNRALKLLAEAARILTDAEIDALKAESGYTGKVQKWESNALLAEKLVAAMDAKKALTLCGVCEEFRQGVIADDGVNVCPDCKARSEAAEAPYMRPAQQKAAASLEIIPVCVKQEGRKLQISALASENTHTKKELLFLPAPKGVEHKFQIGDYVVVDPAHPEHYGTEGRVTGVKQLTEGGKKVFTYALDAFGCTGIAENFLHSASPEKPAAYVAYKAQRGKWLGKTLVIWTPEALYTYEAGAREIEIHTGRKGHWHASGVYELVIPRDQLPDVLAAMAVTRFPVVVLTPEGRVPPIPRDDDKPETPAVSAVGDIPCKPSYPALEGQYARGQRVNTARGAGVVLGIGSLGWYHVRLDNGRREVARIEYMS